MTIYEFSVKTKFVKNLIELTRESPKIWDYSNAEEKEEFTASLNGRTIACSKECLVIEGETIVEVDLLEELYTIVVKSVVENSAWYEACKSFLSESKWTL